MIIRRLTKHVIDQNWFAVGINFFILIGTTANITQQIMELLE